MSISRKISSREQLHELIPRLKGEGKKVGFTSGVFDLLHPGHVDYLQEAKTLCDILVVGVNSDSSVRENKGSSRPICPEADRAHVIAALESVDYVFVFSEKNNNRNIEELKPDLYIKAGDYSKANLSSAPLVEGYGGQVKLVSLVGKHSSTKIIEKINSDSLNAFVTVGELAPAAAAPVVFLDRDGTINEEVSYLHEPHKLKIIPGALAALKKLQAAGFKLVIVTNQPGIGLGYFSKEDFFKVTRSMLYEVASHGIKFSKIYFCPHSESDGCACRKPNTMLLDRAKSEMAVDWENSFVIGDMTSDVELANRAGLKSILLQTGSAGKDGKFKVTPSSIQADLLAAADYILATVADEKKPD